MHGVAGDQDVIIGIADDPVRPDSADEQIAPTPTAQEVFARAAQQDIVPGTALEPVIALLAEEPGGEADAPGDLDVVVASLTVNDDAPVSGGRCRSSGYRPGSLGGLVSPGRPGTSSACKIAVRSRRGVGISDPWKSDFQCWWGIGLAAPATWLCPVVRWACVAAAREGDDSRRT